MSPQLQNRLTTAVKRFLDIFWVIFFSLAVIWPIVVIVVGLHIPPDPVDRHTDVSAFLSFKVFTDASTELAADPAAKGSLLLSGKGDVLLNNTKSNLAWWVAGAISEAMLLIFLFGLKIMRRLFTSLAEGSTFTDENAERMRRIGFVFIGFNVIKPVMQYIGSRMLLADMATNTPGVELYPAFEMSIAGIFAGVAIIVLSGVLREAIAMAKEQELTI